MIAGAHIDDDVALGYDAAALRRRRLRSLGCRPVAFASDVLVWPLFGRNAWDRVRDGSVTAFGHLPRHRP